MYRYEVIARKTCCKFWLRIYLRFASVVITGVDLCERSKSAQLNIIICLARPERWGVTPSPSLLVESPLNTVC